MSRYQRVVTCSDSESEEVKSKKMPEKVKKTKPRKGFNAEEEEEANQEDDFAAQTLPGQKYPAPPDGDGTRIFYETLLQQSPGDKMAQKWLIEHGLLPIEELSKVLQQ